MRNLERRDFLQMAGWAGVALGSGRIGPAVATSRKASDFAWKLIAPGNAGMSQAGLDGIGAAIRRNIEAKTIAGAVTAVARHGKLVWFDAQGWADVEARKPMTKDSLFRMMSSTKVVTAVAALMMIEEGKLALEDPVSKFIPSFRGQRVAIAPPGTADATKIQYVPATRDITVKDLLTHTSGLSTAGGIPATTELRNKIHRRPNDRLSTIIPQLGALALDFQPGTLFRYSPLDGMDTLLYLVELVSGIGAERFVHERIFQPLDMRNSYFNVPAAKRARIVQLYGLKDKNLVRSDPLFPGFDTKYISGSGGLVSDAHDMLNFEMMLLNRGVLNGRRIIKPETVALMTRDYVGKLFREWFPPLTQGNDFGLGVRILADDSKSDGRAIGAFGWGGAYGTETWVDPKLDVAVAMMVQMDFGSPVVRVDFTKAVRNAIVA